MMKDKMKTPGKGGKGGGSGSNGAMPKYNLDLKPTSATRKKL